MSPPITLFLTTIASEPRLRSRQEYLLRIFQVKQIPFSAYDMASDERARKLWKRKVPPAKQQLPGFLVDNTFIGTVEDFEAAVEAGDHVMRKFLRLDDEYNEELERAWNTPAPEVVPIGVPGVQKPSEISGHQTVWHGPKDKPIDKSKVIKHDAKLAQGEIDLTETLGEFGLEGVVVTADELAELVAELNLGKEEAANLVKGIADASAAANPPSPPPEDEVQPEKAKAKEERKPVSFQGKPEVHLEPVLNPAPPLPAPPKPKTPPPKAPTLPSPPSPTSTPTPTIKPTPASPPPKPIVKVDTSAALTAPSPHTPLAESPGLLTPASAIPILASRETLAQLAEKVEAKRRSRTDAKPRRSTLSPMFPSSPQLDDVYELPPESEDAAERVEPRRERKPSQIESSKPKVAFPVTDPSEAYSTEPAAASPSPSPSSPAAAQRASQIPVSSSRTRVLSTTSRTGSVPPPTASPVLVESSAPATTTGTPARSRATSQHRTLSTAGTPRERKQSTTRAPPPSAFKPEDVPPVPVPKSASRSSTLASTPSRSSTGATPSKQPTPSRSNSAAGTPVRERKKSAYGATRPTLPPSASRGSIKGEEKGK